MKVAILGATGPSGLQLVQEALERGHYVTALVRNPGKLGHIENPNLKVGTRVYWDTSGTMPSHHRR